MLHVGIIPALLLLQQDTGDSRYGFGRNLRQRGTLRNFPRFPINEAADDI
jgi:hypothetical protein